MGLYERWVLPRVVDLVCGIEPMRRERSSVVPLAAGRVLEIGFGTGLNLPFYDAAKVDSVWAVEPSRGMLQLARRRMEEAPFPVEVLETGGEQIPLETASADSAVVTFTLCTIPDVEAALREIRRVLRPGAPLLFCEHGLAPEEGVRKWQRRLTPLWSPLAGGCHLDRPIADLIRCAGFRLDSLTMQYVRGWRPASFHYVGRAVA